MFAAVLQLATAELEAAFAWVLPFAVAGDHFLLDLGKPIRIPAAAATLKFNPLHLRPWRPCQLLGRRRWGKCFISQ